MRRPEGRRLGQPIKELRVRARRAPGEPAARVAARVPRHPMRRRPVVAGVVLVAAVATVLQVVGGKPRVVPPVLPDARQVLEARHAPRAGARVRPRAPLLEVPVEVRARRVRRSPLATRVAILRARGGPHREPPRAAPVAARQVEAEVAGEAVRLVAHVGARPVPLAGAAVAAVA